MSAFDIAIFAVIAVQIVLYAIQARRVKKLMAVLREMQPMFEDFSSAVDRSEKTVVQLSQASARVSAAVRDEDMVAMPPAQHMRKTHSSKAAAVTSFYDHARGRSQA